jgi:hypothetical protein
VATFTNLAFSAPGKYKLRFAATNGLGSRSDANHGGRVSYSLHCRAHHATFDLVLADVHFVVHGNWTESELQNIFRVGSAAEKLRMAAGLHDIHATVTPHESSVCTNTGFSRVDISFGRFGMEDELLPPLESLQTQLLPELSIDSHSIAMGCCALSALPGAVSPYSTPPLAGEPSIPSSTQGRDFETNTLRTSHDLRSHLHIGDMIDIVYALRSSNGFIDGVVSLASGGANLTNVSSHIVSRVGATYVTLEFPFVFDSLAAASTIRLFRSASHDPHVIIGAHFIDTAAHVAVAPSSASGSGFQELETTAGIEHGSTLLTATRAEVASSSRRLAVGDRIWIEDRKSVV